MKVGHQSIWRAVLACLSAAFLLLAPAEAQTPAEQLARRLPTNNAERFVPQLNPRLSQPSPLPRRPRVVVLFISDGMGFEQLKAASLYARGELGAMSFEQFPHAGSLETLSAHRNVTDSAAAATAMATGRKVHNGTIGVASPGDGHELLTLFDCFQRNKQRVGFVTNSYTTDATPAAFAAHATRRKNYSKIARDYLRRSRPNVIMGGGGHGMKLRDARDAGYSVLTSRRALDAPPSAEHTLALFGRGELSLGHPQHPALSEMTFAALELLDRNNPRGFFLIVENELTDSGGHDRDIKKVVRSLDAFDRAVQTATEWARRRHDVLILVTSDHETGGLEVLAPRGQGRAPKVRWRSRGHTAQPIPLFAQGLGAARFRGAHDNTHMFSLITAAVGLSGCR